MVRTQIQLTEEQFKALRKIAMTSPVAELIRRAVDTMIMSRVIVDPDAADGKPVFNRTVTLRDEWAKIEKGGTGDTSESSKRN